MGKILILGANGFIGRTLTSKMVSLGYRIRGVGLGEDSQTLNGLEYISCDFSKISSFRDLLVDVEVVIHLISTTVPSENTDGIPEEIIQNIVPTVRLLEDMVRCHTKKIVFASSAGTLYGETGNYINRTNDPLHPICSYGTQKQVIENYLQLYGSRYGIDYRIMRITNPYGRGQNEKKKQGLIPIIVRQILRNETITVFGDGNNIRDYIFIDDLINGVLSVLDYKGGEHIFHLGYGRYYSINEVIAMLEERTGLCAKVRYTHSRKCDIVSSIVDTETSQAELDWYPRISLEIGMDMTIESIRKEFSCQ